MSIILIQYCKVLKNDWQVNANGIINKPFIIKSEKSEVRWGFMKENRKGLTKQHNLFEKYGYKTDE